MNERDTAGVIAPPPLLALGALLLAVLLEWLRPSTFLSELPGDVRWPLAAAAFACAFFLITAAIQNFSRAGTAVQTRAPSTALVTTGIYRFLRNPIYVGFFLILVGIGLAAAWDWLIILAAVFLAVIHWGVVRREERYLMAKFGEAYRAYRLRVRRYGIF